MAFKVFRFGVGTFVFTSLRISLWTTLHVHNRARAPTNWSATTNQFPLDTPPADVNGPSFGEFCGPANRTSYRNAMRRGFWRSLPTLMTCDGILHVRLNLHWWVDHMQALRQSRYGLTAIGYVHHKTPYIKYSAAQRGQWLIQVRALAMAAYVTETIIIGNLKPLSFGHKASRLTHLLTAPTERTNLSARAGVRIVEAGRCDDRSE
ncbi:hypothetical protein B0H10DRAFT_1948153 [Mycena sp. CBHHK59/15]|nr:hypothetical protein B0H10DRAFT_1948153 [Mycena sp. CBHHK59/15]